jgi:hypothetical protein
MQAEAKELIFFARSCKSFPIVSLSSYSDLGGREKI